LTLVTLPSPAAPSDPDLTGDEHLLLTQFLDYQRTVLLRKVGELDDDGLQRVMTPSGLTLLGIVKHLAYVERWWFRIAFAGDEGVDPPWTDDDPDADWRVEPGETAEAIRALYDDEVARARAIAAGASFDDIAADPRAKGRSLRWIMLHVLEEYARHLGHADIMREAIDGRTGD
jgi:uncharacterized damage-inducible protein DinB